MFDRNSAETLRQEVQLYQTKNVGLVAVKTEDIMALLDGYLECDRIKEALDEAIDSISILKDENAILDADLEDARGEITELETELAEVGE